MPVVNPLARELVFKIVYYGPGLGGKTTSLQHVHQTARPEHRGRLVSLATPVDRTLYFDFLPVRLPDVRGMSVRLQLFTVPGQVYYNATRKLVLTGADGIVMVVDSQAERLDANLESLDNLRDNLKEHGRGLADVPWVLQYNKRDLPGVLPVTDLEAKLNPLGVRSFESTATSGPGVYEALDAVTRMVLTELERRLPAGRGSDAPGFMLAEGGLAAVLQSAAPPPGRVAAMAEHRDARPAVAAAPAAPATIPAESEPARLRTERQQAAPGSASTPAPSSAPEPAAASPSPLPPKVRRSTWPSIPSSRAQPESERAVDVSWVASSDGKSGFSFAALFAAAERSVATEAEQALSDGDAASAILAMDRLVARILASAATPLSGAADAPRDPALMVLLLGVPGRRYVAFRSLVREARSQAVSTEQALRAYAFVLELCTARRECGSI
jgi:signal recognition particle receptor subunit beta